MKVAIIGGGAAGMSCAYLLDKKHDVTVFEKQPMLGGNIRTLNKNVDVDNGKLQKDLFIDNGVIEFDRGNFEYFHKLMEDLKVELQEVPLSAGFFYSNGKHIYTPSRIHDIQLGPFQKMKEAFKLSKIFFDYNSFMLKTSLRKEKDYYNLPFSHLSKERVLFWWMRMILMYAYSIPYKDTNNIPIGLALSMLRSCLTFPTWNRIVGGTYTYIEKILESFQGTVRCNDTPQSISRKNGGIEINLKTGEKESFDKVIFASPPHEVLKTLIDPTEDEKKRFGAWKENKAQTVIHTDTGMFQKRNVDYFSADLIQKKEGDAGYNAFLNGLSGIKKNDIKYSLAFNLEDEIDPEKIIHIQKHSTPFYSSEAFKYRNEVIETNGENNTFHVGAYLGNGLHEGAICSALRVSKILGGKVL